MYFIRYKIIKCVGFKPIHCVINQDIMSLSRFFSKFDCVSMIVLLV